MQYSVSPTLNPTILGGNPKENLSTLIPESFAAKKWPNSWTKIRIPKTKTKAKA